MDPMIRDCLSGKRFMSMALAEHHNIASAHPRANLKSKVTLRLEKGIKVNRNRSPQYINAFYGQEMWGK